MVNEEQYYTAKEAAELLGVTDSAFNNAVSLAREMRGKRWHYPQSSIDKYQRIREGNTEQAANSAELPPAAMQSLDPLLSEEEAELANNDDVCFTAERLGLLEEEPCPSKEDRERVRRRYDEEFANVDPEIAMFNLVMSQLRRQVSSEYKGKFIAELKGVRDTVVALIDTIIEEYQSIE